VKSAHKRPIIFIVGPTAIGKTRFAIALAERINGEIISCDSMQVYKGMDILSQAPSMTERSIVRHHLVGMLDPQKEYSVASFRKKAIPIIESIIERGRIPIVVGGSGLYAKAIIDGLFPSPAADTKYRDRLQKIAMESGPAALHRKLARVDPESALRIHPNDLRRIIRALEVIKLTGRTMTKLKAATKGLKDIYKIKLFGLTAPREEIYSKINSRVDRMFANGVVKEVLRLSKKRMSKTSGAVLGLKEIIGFLNREYDLGSAKEMIKMNTRRFAKRQLTWFRHDDRIKWHDVTRSTEAAIIKSIVKDTL
jgi:tRNA dimethylallyltransferase